MSISSDQYMQKMETGMVDVRQCVIKMEASLQKLVADSKAMQQLVKQSLAKDKQGAAAGKSDAGADAKSGPLDNVISGLSKKLADGIGGAILKMMGLDEKKKDASGDSQAQGAGSGAGAGTAKGSDGTRDDKSKEKAGSLKDKSTIEIMQKAIEDFGGSAEDANKRIYESMSVALKSSSDALVKFVTTGKLNFSDLAKSIISDILKIQAKAAIAGLAQFLLGTAASFIGSFGNAGSIPVGDRLIDQKLNLNVGGTGGSGLGFNPNGIGPGFRAAGGFDIPSGMNPVTQLHEKEMVLPAQYADVIRGLANNGGASGGGININTSISVASDGTSNRKSDGGGDSQRQLANMINDQTRAVIAREMRQGGLIWNMQMGAA